MSDSFTEHLPNVSEPKKTEPREGPGPGIILGTPVGSVIGAAAGAVFWGVVGRRFLGRATYKAGAWFGLGAWVAGGLAERAGAGQHLPDAGPLMLAVRIPLAVANVPGVLAVGAAAAAAGELSEDVRITLAHANTYSEQSGR